MSGIERFRVIEKSGREVLQARSLPCPLLDCCSRVFDDFLIASLGEQGLPRLIRQHMRCRINDAGLPQQSANMAAARCGWWWMVFRDWGKWRAVVACVRVYRGEVDYAT